MKTQHMGPIRCDLASFTPQQYVNHNFDTEEHRVDFSRSSPPMNRDRLYFSKSESWMMIMISKNKEKSNTRDLFLLLTKKIPPRYIVLTLYKK